VLLKCLTIKYKKGGSFINSKTKFLREGLLDVVYYSKQAEIKKEMLILTVLFIITSVTNVITSYYYSKLLNDEIKNSGINLIIHTLIIYGLVRVFFIVNSLIADIISKKIKQKIIYKFRHITLEAILDSDYEWLQSNQKGDLVGRLQENIVHLSDTLGEFIPDMIRRSLVSIFAIIVLSFINIWLSIIFLTLIMLMLYFQVLGGYYCKGYLDEMENNRSVRNALYYDLISNDKTIQIFKMANHVDQWLETKTKNFIRSMTKAMSMITLIFSPAIIINQLTLIIPSLIGSSMAIYGRISLQNFILAISLISIASEELKGFDAIFANLPSILANGKKIKDIWNCPKEIEGISKDITFESNPITLQNCTFRYIDSDVEILKGLSIKIKTGEKVAIVGKSGCGKSTLLKIISGLYSCSEGNVKIWDKEINKYDKNILYRYIGYVPQESTLFSDTVYYNLMITDEENKSKKVKDILEKLLLTNFLDRLNSNIAEFERNISGGEKQRLSLARILLREPRILLLDEVTSALDIETEEKVNKYLLSLSNVTILSSIHKVHLTKDYDRIIVMDNGRIIEEGTYYELLARKGSFYNMFRGVIYE
jgi:ABC-type multidrug transport system fused ATPase/permease subunit